MRSAQPPTMVSPLVAIAWPSGIDDGIVRRHAIAGGQPQGDRDPGGDPRGPQAPRIVGIDMEVCRAAN